MYKTAIVILNWNGEELLKQFLSSVVKFSNQPDTKIYVIDNFSTDGSCELITRHYPEVGLIKLDANYGFAGGYNRGLKHIKATYYVLLNSDIEVTPNWLQACISRLESDKNIAACMPKIKSFRNRDNFEHAGAAGGFIDKYGYPFCRGRLMNVVEKDMGQYDRSIEIFWATGACMFVRADLFESFGGFDSDFFAHMEEIDLCWRFKNRGYQIFYEPESVVYHVGGATLDYMNPQKTYLNFRNSLFMLFKNLAPNKLYCIFFIRLILDGIASLKFLFSLEFGNFIAVVKAHFAFYMKIGKFWPKRIALKKVNTNYKHLQITKNSIVYQFFIMQRKHYSDLNMNL